MAMITVAIPTVGGQKSGVLAEKITAHLAIHPALVIGWNGDTRYDESALELTHILSGALVCQIRQGPTACPEAVHRLAHWLETVCRLDKTGRDAIAQGLPKEARTQIRRFADSPSHWRPPEDHDVYTTTAAEPREPALRK